ncbi:histidine triad nucleotide-binding protein [Striga asiatica]|uniref:Histidine triad nucleotide-binding protein n=1 Tax=Striga asiatica TaxID=4170 RepID=A0A5A7QDW9_STRAF|nr:histidine triad nucleotide-binding protein [Striga asiatica]
MAVLLEDIVKSVEQLLKLIGKKSEEQSFVDPTLDPVLLVPGIAGSILNAVNDKTGKTERVWVRILAADHEFRDKLWSRFDPATGKTVTLDDDTHIEVPQDRYGLYAIDMLDPDMVIGGDCVYYFHDMIAELISWGYKEGTTLFGFGYDFRQSNRSLSRYVTLNYYISALISAALLLECPSIYELMACLDFKWEHVPLLEIWRQRHNSDDSPTVMLESYSPAEAIPIFMEALSINKIKFDGSDISVPFNVEILKWANETRKLLSSAEVPGQIKFYNIYGTNYETPHTVCYGSENAPVSDLRELPTLLAKYINVDGDGTVPVESAKADGLRAEARVGVPGDHRGILCDLHVFRILKHWLKADHDPFYNPLNDYVILPTAFDLEAFKTNDGLQVTKIKEEWEIIGDVDPENEKQPLVGTIDVARVGGSVQEEAHATLVIDEPEKDGKKHVELSAVSISASAGPLSVRAFNFIKASNQTPRISLSPFARRPLLLRRVLSSVSATSDEEASAKAAAVNADGGAPTIFDKIISKEIPSTIVYEDEDVLAFRDINAQAPVHVLVIPKLRDGLTQLGKAEKKHEEILGHLLYAAKIVAEKEGIVDGFRVVINSGPSACQSVYHLHLHVLGGRQMKWPPG